jgi:hypothetical protein
VFVGFLGSLSGLAPRSMLVDAFVKYVFFNRFFELKNIEVIDGDCRILFEWFMTLIFFPFFFF